MATAPTYCTHKQLKRIFPQMDAYDNKRQIVGWVEVSTNKYAAHNSGLVTQLFSNGEDLGPAQSAHTDLNVEGEWFYNSAEDVLYYFTASTPADKLIEAGEEFSEMISDYLGDASRFLDSRLDPNLPREQLKDKSGNFDYLIIRTTGLLAAAFLIKSHEPTSEVGDAFMEEAELNITNMNEGKAALSYQTTADTSKGIVRDVTYTSGSIRPVDTRGRARGVDYDLIKVYIDSGEGGVLGTAKYSVAVKDSTKLKNEVLIDSEIITGDFQKLAYGLEIRFAGSADDSVATANNEWEIEVGGAEEEQDLPGNVRSIQLTRGGRGATPPLSSDHKRRESEEWR